MARFRGTMTGNGGEVSRLGTAKSGIEADINGWNCGIKVIAKVSNQDEDVFDVYITSGSNHKQPGMLIGYAYSSEHGFRWVPSTPV